MLVGEFVGEIAGEIVGDDVGDIVVDVVGVVGDVDTVNARVAVTFNIKDGIGCFDGEGERVADAESEPVPVTDALDPRDKLDVGVFEREGDKVAVDEAVVEGVIVDEPVPVTVAVTLSVAVLVIEPVPELLGEVEAEDPSVSEGVGVFETEELRVDVVDDVDDGVGVPDVVPELVSV